MRVPRINPTVTAISKNLAMQVTMSVIGSVAVKYGTDALVRGIEASGKRFKKKRPIGFIR